MSSSHKTWSLLSRYLSPRARLHASEVHGRGLNALRLSETLALDFCALRERVGDLCGWNLVPCEGEVALPDFFELLKERCFPVGRAVRPENQLYGAVDPDLWHEAFGHLPFLADDSFRTLYAWFGKKASHAWARGENYRFDELGSLYWYLLEYGILREAGRPRLIGAGILASPLGIERFINGQVKLRRFDVARVSKTPSDPHLFQSTLFIVDNLSETFSQLRGRYGN